MLTPPTDTFIFAVDVDGVCAKYDDALRTVLLREHSINSPLLPDNFDPAKLDEHVEWNFSSWGIDEAQFHAIHDLGVREYRFLRDMEVMEGCVDALWRLSDAGVWIRLVTHRIYTNWGHNIVVADTAHWLDKVRIPYRDLCFLSTKSNVASHVAVDDAPHQVAELRAAGRHVIVFDAPYNRELASPRAHGWAEVEEQVMTLLTEFAGSATQVLPGVPVGAERLGEHPPGDLS